MSEFLFELVGQDLRPVLPREDRAPDEIRIYTAVQCAAHFGGTKESYEAEWLSFYRSDALPVEPGEQLHSPITAGEKIQAAVENAELEVLRIVRFPHLTNDNHWRFVKNECRRLGIHPSDIWVKLEPNDETGEDEPKIITTILMIRQIVEKSGLKKGETSPQYCGSDGKWVDVWTNQSELPRMARAYIYRTDREMPIEGIAYASQCASYARGKDGRAIIEDGKPALTKAWRDGYIPQLGKCASVAAHKAAFHGLFGNTATKEENDPDSLPKFSRKGEPPEWPKNPAAAPLIAAGADLLSAGAMKPVDPPDDPKVAWRLVDECTPESTPGLRRELLEIGVATREKTDAVIDDFKRKLPRLASDHFKAFCAIVLAWVKDNPRFYGVTG